MYLADTNVLSESDPAKNPTAKAFTLDLQTSAVFISTVTVTEIRYGIELLAKRGATAKAAQFEGWWELVRRLYAGRILTFDLAAADAAAVIAAEATITGHQPEWADIQIAAIARARGLTVLTRNARRFAPLGVPFVDPFASA